MLQTEQRLQFLLLRLFPQILVASVGDTFSSDQSSNARRTLLHFLMRSMRSIAGEQL